MKAYVRIQKTAAMAAVFFAGAMGVVVAQSTDTNATTVAYWQLGGTITDANSASGYSIADLATNVGQGTLTGAIPNLWVLGPIAGNTTFASSVPPASLFNPSAAFNAGTASWDAGADEFSGPGGEIDCDTTAFGLIFNARDFTEEVFFKTDYTNDPTLGTVKQTLVWDHQSSAYAELQLNESAAGNPEDIGSLLFWSWNVQNFPTCRVTAAQNGGHRLDDGQWHYAAARYNDATLTMDLLVVNQDGSTAESSTYIGASLNPGGSGPLIIGNDESYATPFDGLINQVRFSNVTLPVAQLLANASSCSAPGFSSTTATTNVITVGSALNLSAANWPVLAQGGPLEFQWQLNGTNLPGQTNINLTLYPATLAQAGTYQQIASIPCGGVSATSAPVVVSIVPAINLARWSFNFTEDTTYPQATVDDSAPGYINVYDLITFNNQPNPSGIGSNGEIPLTNSIPPATMFINGNNGGTNAFDAAYLAGQDGVVFYPAGPDVFDFQTSFSLELFFRSYGDQSNAGTMELICQGTDGGNTFRYGVNLNQAGPGALCFKINNYAIAPAGQTYEDTNAGIQSVVINNANFADGNWHYLLAKYDAIGNTLSLNVANTDGTGTNASVTLPAHYSPLAARFEGNLFIGRYRYPWGNDNRNFIGSIDEVQVSAGLVTPGSGQLGYLPGVVVPQITHISVAGSTVTITFTGSSADPASAFTLVGASTVNGTFSALPATVTPLGAGSFQATIAMSGNTEFYRIQR